MIPKIIHYVWVGDSPKPPEVLACIESWRRLCPGWDIREWGNDSAAGAGGRYVREAISHRKWAFASDWIRLYALERFGGFYLDTDMEMRKPFDEFLKERFVISWERMNGRTNLNCGVIGSEAGGEVVRSLLAVYEDLPFVMDDGELDLTPNTVRLLKTFADRWGVHPSFDGSDTVRFADGCVIFPCTHFLPEGGYTYHHYAATWLDAWLRKVWLKMGPYKLVRFKRRLEATEPDFMLQNGERKLFSLPLGARKRIALLKRTEGRGGNG